MSFNNPKFLLINPESDKSIEIFKLFFFAKFIACMLVSLKSGVSNKYPSKCKISPCLIISSLMSSFFK